MARLVAFTQAGRTWPERKVANCGVVCLPAAARRLVCPRGLGDPAGHLGTKAPRFREPGPSDSLLRGGKVTLKEGAGRTLWPLWVCI